MTDDLTETLRGRRAMATIKGEDCPGTITSVTYTPKKGDLVVALSLDDPAPSGNSSVALALDDVELVSDD